MRRWKLQMRSFVFSISPSCIVNYGWFHYQIRLHTSLIAVAHITNFDGLLYQFWWSVSAVSAVRICKYGCSYQYRVKRVSKGGGGIRLLGEVVSKIWRKWYQKWYQNCPNMSKTSIFFNEVNPQVKQLF